MVFDSEGVEVGGGRGEVEEGDGGGFGVWGGVVVSVDATLGEGRGEDALGGLSENTRHEQRADDIVTRLGFETIEDKLADSP